MFQVEVSAVELSRVLQARLSEQTEEGESKGVLECSEDCKKSAELNSAPEQIGRVLAHWSGDRLLTCCLSSPVDSFLLSQELLGPNKLLKQAQTWL